MRGKVRHNHGAPLWTQNLRKESEGGGDNRAQSTHKGKGKGNDHPMNKANFRNFRIVQGLRHASKLLASIFACLRQAVRRNSQGEASNPKAFFLPKPRPKPTTIESMRTNFRTRKASNPKPFFHQGKAKAEGGQVADPVRNLIFFRAFFGPCMTIIVENFGTKTTHANHTWHDWHFFCRRHVAESGCTDKNRRQPRQWGQDCHGMPEWAGRLRCCFLPPGGVLLLRPRSGRPKFALGGTFSRQHLADGGPGR